MVDLSPKASAVVAAARRSLQATEADRDRIGAALRARLGPAALPPEPLVSDAGAGWSFVLPGAAIGACVVAAALFLLNGARTNRATEPRPITTALVASSPAPSAVAPAAVEPAATEPAAEPAAASAVNPLPSTVGPRGPALDRRDRLSAEVALLSRATSALGAGRAGEALKVLNQHQREFPSGVLSEERRAAKAQALCSLGRVSEGRTELARLIPQSPAAARAKRVCDAATPRE
ncbi:MAG TPA: hypothetical protein VEQ59_13070 [Polyangiaceae bacterium]|nr:hypothetical protein [Polyangiaceae bacterium]